LVFTSIGKPKPCLAGANIRSGHRIDARRHVHKGALLREPLLFSGWHEQSS
jgi:hypothetical protein